MVYAARLRSLQTEERESHNELARDSLGVAEGLDGSEMLDLMLELMGERYERARSGAVMHFDSC